MINLISYEFEKIAKKPIVISTFVLLFIINLLLFYSYSVKGEMAFDNGKKLRGLEAVAFDKSVATKYEGELTDQKVREILNVYGNSKINDVTGYNNNTVNRFISQIIISKNEIRPISEVFPFAKEPLIYGYAGAWHAFIMQFVNIVMFLFIGIIISITPVFSEEYSRETAGLILTTYNGKGKSISAKIIASFLFVLLVYAVFVVFNIVLHGTYYGFEGLNVSIQSSIYFSDYPVVMNYGQLVAIVLLYFFFGIIGTASIALLFSALCKTPFLAIIFATTVNYTPYIIWNMMDKEAISKIVTLFPICLLNLHIVLEGLLKYSYNIGIGIINYDFMTIGVIIVGMCSCCIIAYKKFKMHQA